MASLSPRRTTCIWRTSGLHRYGCAGLDRKAVEIVRSGRLGRLVAVAGTAMFYKPDSYFADAPWRGQPGGGPLASQAARGLVVEDSVAIGLRFASGALGTFMLSDTAASARSWEQTSQEDKNYAAYPDEDCYVIAGTEGSLAIPTPRLKT